MKFRFLVLGSVLLCSLMVLDLVSRWGTRGYGQTAPDKKATENLPSRGIVVCDTSKGTFRLVLNEREAPNSVATLKKMVEARWLEDVAFFRVNDVAVQFGVKGKEFKFPLRGDWERDKHPVPEKALRKPWVRGDVSMIGGPHMFIVKKNTSIMGLNDLDGVVARIPQEDMLVVDALYRWDHRISHRRRNSGAQIQ